MPWAYHPLIRCWPCFVHTIPWEGVNRHIEASEETEILIDAMQAQVMEAFGHKPRTHLRKARQQLLVIAKKKEPRICKIRNTLSMVYVI